VRSTRALVAVVAALVVGLAILGFLFGLGSAPSAQDAKRERAAAYKDAVESGSKGGVYRRHYVRGYRKGFKAGERKARVERAKRRTRERRAAAGRVDGRRVGSNTTGGAAPSELGCAATYILPDGTTGCARNYGD
jgi:hypothetical protein